MAAETLENTGEPTKGMGRLLGDIDPDTGDLLVDPATGLPRLTLHYSAREAAPLIGVSHNEVRRRCRTGEWPSRTVQGSTYLSMADVAAAIESLRTGPRFDATGPLGIRGAVADEDGAES